MTKESQTSVENTTGSQSPLFGTKKCFIAAPIGANGSEDRRRSDLVKRYIIDEAVQPLGYTTVRADEIDKSGEITTQIVSDLIEADLLIADLTGQNANVFYELAIRHSFRKPYIQIIEDGDELPFDVRAFRTVFVNHRDLESAAEAREAIKRMIQDIESGGDVQSPVTHAVNRQQLETSKDPGGKELAQIGEIVERIDLRMRKLESPSSRRDFREHRIINEFMQILDKVVVKKHSLMFDDLDGLKSIANMNKDPELHNFVKHLEEHALPF
ncbi:hypothetical protein [Rhodococcus rhodochrous]|uniref:hypothetical protein n=1 Tax=Rhodococcus rhodochrous TaxID=1829 RepID=UPI0024BB4A54|nr:hypothetical protein [Rhodococcus rhodochrous]MDJ0401744.1 hypothetical protein [Rhodococcus rhodochrous]